MRKTERHQLIKQIIASRTVRTQDELLGFLKEKGVIATQATISRDIRDLKIVKVPDENGRVHFEIFQERTLENGEQKKKQQLIHMIEDVVTKVDRVQFLTMINTIADNAPLLSAALDDVAMPEKVCSLAGFDIVVIISRTEDDAKKMEAFFNSHAIL